MPIQRTSEQQAISLEEFYSEKEMGSRFQYFGKDMHSFLGSINALFPGTQLYGMTSHERLIILKSDAYVKEWLVIVSTVAGEFYIEYRMPKDNAPWKDAYVRGTAKSLDEARKFLLIAMRECKSWDDNEELKQRLEEYDLQRTTDASQNGG